MVTFKILAESLPLKWQMELRQALAGTTSAPPPPEDKKPVDPASAIDVTADGLQIVDIVVGWIRKMNRQQKSEKTFTGQGISLRIEKSDGKRISLTERNGVVVKQFLMFH